MADKNLYHEFLDSTPAQQDVPVGITDSLLVPRNLARVGLIIEAPLTQVLYLAWNGVPSATVGIRLPAGGAPLVLTAALHGALVYGPIRAVLVGGAEVISYVESISNCPCTKG